MGSSEETHVRSSLVELADRIGRYAKKDGTVQPVDGLYLHRSSQSTERVHGVSKPCLCIIAQGAKEVFLADSVYRYDASQFLIVTVDLPITGRIVEASFETPYLALRLDLDPGLVGSIMVEAGITAFRPGSDDRGLAVNAIDSGLLDAVLRYVRLLDASPTDFRILTPLAMREITYRLLTSNQGHRLRHLTAVGGHSQQIAQAIEKLRTEYDRPLRIDQLAGELGMSSSGFHHHFKSITAMSPLQYQKQIRMQEARRLMLGESLDAATAGYRVGYEDASHFSRDYKRLFGTSPIRDIERLRSMVAAE